MANLADDETDVSGLPPVANPKQVGANMDRKVNRAGAPPQPRPAPSREPETPAPTEDTAAASPATPRGGRAGDIYSSLLPRGPQSTGPDWGGLAASQPWMAYHATKNVADHLGAFLSGTGLAELPGDAARHVGAVYNAALDPKAISASVQNLFEQDTAQAEVAKFYLSAGGLLSPDQAATGFSDVLPMTANPTLPAGGSVVGAAGLAGAGLVSAFADRDPNEQASAVAWAALTGMILGAGHVPGGSAVRSQLARAFQKWPEIESRLQGVIRARRDYKRSAVAGDPSPVEDYIRHYLTLGGFPGRVTTLAKPGEVEQTMTRLPSGDLVLKAGQGGKQAAKALRTAGVGSVHDLLAKAATEGISDKRVIDAIVKGYKALGLRYPLERVNPADVALGDPVTELRAIHNDGDAARTTRAIESLRAFEAMLGHVHEGIWAHSGDPAEAILRSVAGHNRTAGSTDLLYGHWISSLEDVARNAKVDGAQVAKAITGDEKAYASLPAEGRLIAKQWRIFGNALMHESKTTGYSRDFIGNWLPLLLKDTGSPIGRVGSAALKTASKAHKADALRVDDEGKLFAAERFRNADEANAAQQSRRAGLVSELVDPARPLRKEIADLAEAKAIRAQSVADPKAARMAAQDFASRYYGDFEHDFFQIARRWNARGLKAVRTHQALNLLAESMAKDGQPLVRKVNDAHEASIWEAAGYRSLPGKATEGYAVHGDLAPTLRKYVETAPGLKDVKGLKDLARLEGLAVAAIMYSPVIHTLNIASRMGAAALMNPLEMASYLARGRALTPAQRDLESLQLRKAAIDYGYVPDYNARSWFDNLSGRMDAALGTVDEGVPAEAQPPSKLGLRNVPAALQHAHDSLNRYFWSQYRDFGTMMFHLERSAALKHGFSDADAGLYAADRAKAWVGLANPEDHASPLLHDAARLVMFAPEWWNSWRKLLVPVYKRHGMTNQHAAYAAYQGAKFWAAALAFQRITGNLANFALTSSTPWAMNGHLQSQNLAGNQDRIEATAPWLDHVPGFDAIAQSDPKTGGRRTLENPLARQTRDTLMAAGLESGHPDYQLQDTWDGLTKVAVSRFAPLLDGVAGLANVDLYRSLTSGQLAHINRDQPVGLEPRNLLYSALMMSPLGSQWAEKMASDANDPNFTDATAGPFGAKVPKGMASLLGDTKTATERMLFTWLTGVNPPYEYAQRSRGQQPSDADYIKYEAAKKTYDQTMSRLSAQALGGQITPSRWLEQYRQAHATYATQAEGTFRSAPHYVNGTDGLVNDWEAIYDDPRVKLADGSIDYAELSRLQADFRTKKTPAEMADLNKALKANDQRYPMLGLYRKTIDSYRQFQDEFAAAHGLDANQLRREISGYGALYGDPTGSARYLQTHREVSMYEAAKRRQWDTSPAGLMLALFYDSPSAARYMQAHHLTAAQVEREAKAS